MSLSSASGFGKAWGTARNVQGSERARFPRADAIDSSGSGCDDDTMWMYVEETNRPNPVRRTSGAAAPPNICPHIAVVYQHKVVRLAAEMAYLSEYNKAVSAIHRLIERIVLTPNEKRADVDTVLHGDLGTILRRPRHQPRVIRNPQPAKDDRHLARGMSALVVAGARYSRDRHALVVEI